MLLSRLRHIPATHQHSLALFLVLLGCYAYFFPRWADWNQNSRFDLVLALVDDHALTIDKYVANTGDYAYYGGHYYSDKAPGMSLLGVPAYAVFRKLVPATATSRLHSVAAGNEALQATLRQGGAGLEYDRTLFFVGLAATTFLTVAIPSALLGLLFFTVAGHFGCSERQGLVATVLYALATSAFPYANSLVGHQTSAFLLFAAFAVLFAIRRGTMGRPWLLAAGFLLGYAAITEYPTLLMGALLGLYAALTLGKLPGTVVPLAGGALPPLVALGVYDYAAFGTPLPVGYAYSSLWTELHQTGFVSLTYPRPEALWGITFGLHRGLFFLSPYLLFAVPGYFALWRDRGHRPEFWVLLLAPLSFLLFNASSAMWQGGFAVGPRYLVPSLPFLALAAGIGMAWAWRRLVLRPALVLAGAWSVFAVWAETIAGQAFPDYTPNPLFDLSLPRLAAGDIARNAGMLLGLAGWASLAPLLMVVLLAMALIGLSSSNRPVHRVSAPENVRSKDGWAWQ